MKGKKGRAGSLFRMDLLYDLMRYGNKGELWTAVVAEITTSLRVDPTKIAKMQDLNSAFSRRGLQGMRECLPGYYKGARNIILPSCEHSKGESIRSISKCIWVCVFRWW